MLEVEVVCKYVKNNETKVKVKSNNSQISYFLLKRNLFNAF